MEDLIESVLSIRGETRLKAMVNLVQVLQNSELGDDLFGLYSIAETTDNPNDYIERFEVHILDLVSELFSRMGLTIDYKSLQDAPHRFVWIFTLLDELEEFEEIDAVTAIISSEEDEIVVLNNLIHYVVSDVDCDYYELVLHAEPRFFKAIEGNIKSRKIASTREEMFATRAKRIMSYLFDGDEKPFHGVFENYDKYNTVDDVLGRINLHELEDTPIDAKLISTIATGVLLSVCETYEDARGLAQKVIDELSIEEPFPLGGYRDFDAELKGYYTTNEVIMNGEE